MVAEVEGVSCSSSTPELPFHCPSWFREFKYGHKCQTQQICWNHEICEAVESLCGCSLHPEEDKCIPLKSQAEKKKEWEERMKKMKCVLRTMEEDCNLRTSCKRTTRSENQIMEEKERKLKKLKEELDKEIARFAKLKEQPIKEWSIEEGESYDVLGLLSSASRDYLIKYNGDQVHIGQLSGKHILLYFSCLKHGGPTPHDPVSNLHIDLEEIYSAYHPKGMFEVVFVALGNNEDIFLDFFSRMPWLAVPHQDQQSRNFFKTKFDIPDWTYATPVLFDPNGIVLLKDASGPFRGYGVEGFPFTRQKMMAVHEDACEIWSKIVHKKQKLPLAALLGDTLVSSQGNLECTSKLEGKTVGLYFFETSSLGFHQARVLLDSWKVLKKKGYNNFEIILINEGSVNHLFAKAVFKDKFGTIPWYSLPFDGRKLCQIFRFWGIRWDEYLVNAGYLIVLQADKYEPISYFAYDILETFGVDSYPFTLESAVTTAIIKQQKTIVLSKLLSPSAPLLRGASTDYKENIPMSNITVSHLSGKLVLLLFATHLCFEVGSFFHRLRRMYDHKKGTRDEFEVVYISLDCNEKPSSFLRSIQKMPWLFHSFVPDFAVSLYEKVFQYPPRLPAIAAFGSDGHLQTKLSNLFCRAELNSVFPFIQADLDREVHREILSTYRWDLQRLFSSVDSKMDEGTPMTI